MQDIVLLAELLQQAQTSSRSQKTRPRSTTQVTASAAAAATTPGGKSSEGSCPPLSKELIASFAVQNTIMLTVSDWRIFETFGVNWMKHLNRFGVGYYIVGATDKRTSDFLSGQVRAGVGNMNNHVMCVCGFAMIDPCLLNLYAD